MKKAEAHRMPVAITSRDSQRKEIIFYNCVATKQCVTLNVAVEFMSSYGPFGESLLRELAMTLTTTASNLRIFCKR